MFDSPSKRTATGPLGWMRNFFSRAATEARLAELTRTRKLPPITRVIDNTGREPLPPD